MGAVHLDRLDARDVMLPDWSIRRVAKPGQELLAAAAGDWCAVWHGDVVATVASGSPEFSSQYPLPRAGYEDAICGGETVWAAVRQDDVAVLSRLQLGGSREVLRLECLGDRVELVPSWKGDESVFLGDIVGEDEAYWWRCGLDGQCVALATDGDAVMGALVWGGERALATMDGPGRVAVRRSRDGEILARHYGADFPSDRSPKHVWRALCLDERVLLVTGPDSRVWAATDRRGPSVVQTAAGPLPASLIAGHARTLATYHDGVVSAWQVLTADLTS